MNPATRNHRVAVWKNDKVANFFQTSWALLLQARFRLKWSLILNNWNLMKNVLCGFANIFELVTIALNELRNDFKRRNFACRSPEILKRTSQDPIVLKRDYDHLLLVKSRSLFVLIFFSLSGSYFPMLLCLQTRLEHSVTFVPLSFHNKL